MSLTVKAIETMKPGASRREIPDGDVRGLYLSVFPSGKASSSVIASPGARPSSRSARHLKSA
jgi:hypothetical protein